MTMRPILLGVLMLGCGDGSGEGAPATACVSVDGPAPCCAPPAAEDIVCPEGSDRVEHGGRAAGSVVCRTDTGNAGEAVVFYDGRVASYGSSDVGTDAVSCYPETGRMRDRSTRVSATAFCGEECWDASGVVIECPMATPVCE